MLSLPRERVLQIKDDLKKSLKLNPSVRIGSTSSCGDGSQSNMLKESIIVRYAVFEMYSAFTFDFSIIYT
jgi:hypothetical protein